MKGKRFLFKVENSSEASDYLKYEELRNDIWGFPEDNLPGTRNMMCENYLHEGSSLFIGVYREGPSGKFREDKEHLVGFSYGFVGVKDKDIAFKSLGNLWFYSQYTGMRRDFQGFGLGLEIKKFQKEKLVDLFGILTVTCTYDPLTGINAFRNIHCLGMEVLEYRVATYGEYGGFLNRMDVPTDRFFMFWDLQKKTKRLDYDINRLLADGHQALDVDFIQVQGKTSQLEFETVRGARKNLDKKFLLVQIPFDYYLMLIETDVAVKRIRQIPLEWRKITRRLFLDLLGQGYKVIDFQTVKGRRKESYYILRK